MSDQQSPLPKLTFIQGHIVTGIVAFMIGLILWLFYRWAPDLMPFAIAWIFVRPIFKLFQIIERELDL